MGGPDSGKQENMVHYNMAFCFLAGKQVTKPLIAEPERGGAGETSGCRLEQLPSIQLKSGLVESHQPPQT